MLPIARLKRGEDGDVERLGNIRRISGQIHKENSIYSIRYYKFV